MVSLGSTGSLTQFPQQQQQQQVGSLLQSQKDQGQPCRRPISVSRSTGVTLAIEVGDCPGARPDPCPVKKPSV